VGLSLVPRKHAAAGGATVSKPQARPFNGLCGWLEAVRALPRVTLTWTPHWPQVTNRRAIVNGYARTWLVTDVIALLPCDTVALLLSSNHEDQGGVYERTIFVLNALRVRRTPSRMPAVSCDSSRRSGAGHNQHLGCTRGDALTSRHVCLGAVAAAGAVAPDGRGDPHYLHQPRGRQHPGEAWAQLGMLPCEY
jgi:hypothetical protein